LVMALTMLKEIGTFRLLVKLGSYKNKYPKALYAN
jgi:hypothetical protein